VSDILLLENLEKWN